MASVSWLAYFPKIRHRTNAFLGLNAYVNSKKNYKDIISVLFLNLQLFCSLNKWKWMNTAIKFAIYFSVVRFNMLHLKMLLVDEVKEFRILSILFIIRYDNPLSCYY